MNVCARTHQGLLSRLQLIEDLQERLSAIVERGRRHPAFLATERLEEYLVPGCISRVWLIGSFVDGRCYFRIDGDSALVRSLAALICEAFSGATPAEIAAHESDLLEELKIRDQLTPTRQNGLDQVRLAIRSFAARLL